MATVCQRCGHSVNKYFASAENFPDCLSTVAVVKVSPLASHDYSPMKADALLKHNIDALLRARGQGRVELSRWCRRSRSWLDKVYSEQRREIPLKYLDRIADFFGLATYQLFQPGISPLTERRSRTERRTGRDRRLRSHLPQPGTIVTHEIASLKPEDVSDLLLLRTLSASARADLRKTIDEQRRAGRRARKPPSSGDNGVAESE